MEVTEVYHVPFESNYEWRATLFNLLKEMAVEAILDIITKYKDGDTTLEWKDNEGIINFAFEKDMFELIKQKMEEKGTKLSM